MWHVSIKRLYLSSNEFPMTDEIELRLETIEQAIKLIEIIQQCAVGEFVYEIKKIEKEKNNDTSREIDENPDTN